MYFDFSELTGRDTYKLMTATVVPRPIAWVVSQDDAGRLNAAPFSFFGLMSGEPPVIAIGVGSRNGEMKDTGRNLRQGASFVVNLVSRQLLEQMNVTAVDFDSSVDELAEAGLETAPSVKVAPPRIQASPVAYECVVEYVHALGGNRSIAIARVLGMHVHDQAMLDPARLYVDTAGLGLVGRMHGGTWYSLQTDLLELPRITEADYRGRGALAQ